MERLVHRDLALLHMCILEVNTCLNAELFPTHVLRTLKRIIPTEYSSYNKLNLHTHQSIPVLEPTPPILSEAESNQIFASYLHQHPVINYYGKTSDGRALKISDFLTQRQFHNLPLYNEFYRRLNTEHQIAITLPASSPCVVGIAFNRHRRDFSDRDRSCLNLLRPHLLQAYQTAQVFTHIQQNAARLGQELGDCNRGVIVLKTDGGVRDRTEKAWQWVTEYFDSPSPHPFHLPDELQRWVKHQQCPSSEFLGAMASRTPLIIERDSKRLVIRYIADQLGSPCLVLEEQRQVHSAAILEERLKLTPREAEVLFYVAQGCSNQEVASILGQRPTTVKKYLEHIYQKLGVENRSTATLRVMEIFGRSEM